MAADSSPAHSDNKAPFSELFRDGRAFSTILIVLSAAIQALQVLVIAIIMPTVVGDIGGTAYFTWPAMLYTMGGIVGSMCVGTVWNAIGARNGYAVSGVIFLVCTIGCAMAPSMAVLVIWRTIQGLAGGLIAGGSLAMIGDMFDARLRTRVLAVQQTTWTTSHLFGPLVGGMFAEMNWWRGSFWVMVPVIVVFLIITWIKVPARLPSDERAPSSPIPFLRLTVLSASVFCLALAGPVHDNFFRLALIGGAVGLLWWVLRLDDTAANRMFPTHVFAPGSVVGLAMWVLLLGGATQNSLTLFMPLLLQVVHHVNPLIINFLTIIISLGWTIGAIVASGWSGPREKFAFVAGPWLMVGSMIVIAIVAEMPLLPVLTVASFCVGFGTGMHNVHLVSRTLGNAPPGEERAIAGALPSIRQLGTAFGAAVAGILANLAGLDTVTDAEVVGRAVTFIYAFNVVPLTVAAFFMMRFVQKIYAPRALAPKVAE
jgi:MFS family permease